MIVKKLSRKCQNFVKEAGFIEKFILQIYIGMCEQFYIVRQDYPGSEY